MSATVARRPTQEERTALSEQRMLSAAISLIVEVGVAGTTLAAIGERAGYSRGLVTHRYGSKGGLLSAIHDVAVQDWIQRVKQAVGAAEGLEALQRVVDALFGFFAEAPDEIRAMYLLRFASIDPGAEYRDSVARAHRAQRRDAERWIQQGQAAGTIRQDTAATALAELFCSALDGVTYRWMVAPESGLDSLRSELQQQVRLALGRRN